MSTTDLSPPTEFQLAALKLIQGGNPGLSDDPETVIDLDQLLDGMAASGRATTKPSMQFTIRALVKKQLIEKVDVGRRRGFVRVGYKATPRGTAFARPKPLIDWKAAGADRDISEA